MTSAAISLSLIATKDLSDPGLEDISCADHHDDRRDQYQVVLLEVGFQDPTDAQWFDSQIERRRLDPHPAAEEIDSSDDMHDRQAETQGDDRQIGTFESQRGQAEDKSKKSGNECGDDDGKDKRDLKLGHQEGRRIGADGKKPGMTEGYLAGGSHEDVQTHSQYDMDHDDIQEIDVVIGYIKWKTEKGKEQQDRPEKNHSAVEEPDVFVIVALHVHHVTCDAKSRVGLGVKILLHNVLERTSYT